MTASIRNELLSPNALLVSALLLVTSLTVSGLPVAPQNFARVPEGVMRKAAKIVVRPKYPPTSRKRGIQGLAVVMVDINEAGDVMDVFVVDAPDQEIGESVVSAVRQWKFGQLTAEGKPVKLRGKLSFYFSIRDGKTYVSDPKKFSEASQRPAPGRN